MALLLLFSTGFTLGVSGAMIPGPLTFYTVSEVLKSKRSSFIGIILGHIILEFVLVSAIFRGFHHFLTNPVFLTIISYVGAAALISMGILLLFSSKSMKLSTLSSRASMNHKNLIVGGIFFSIISPGFIIWWATIGFSSTLKAFSAGLAGLAAIMLGHWLADISWYGVLAFMVEKGKMFINDRTYQNVIRFFAIVLILIGITFIGFTK